METKTAVTALAALAQESRLAIFRLLVERGPSGMAAGEIGAALALAPATLSFHLKELNHAELVQARQEGRFIFYSARFDRMNDLLGFLTENCCAADGVDCGPGASCAPRGPRKGGAATPARAGAKALAAKHAAAPKRKGVKS